MSSLRDTIEQLQAQIAALRDQLAQVQSERDYLRRQLNKLAIVPVSNTTYSTLTNQEEEGRGLPLGYEHTHASARMWAERGRPL